MEKPTFDQLPEAVSQLQHSLQEIKQLLLSQQQALAPNADEPLTIQQASQLINLSVTTIYGLVQQAKIPVAKQGKKLYFSKAELINWIKQGRKKTAQEISAEAESYIKSKNSGGTKKW